LRKRLSEEEYFEGILDSNPVILSKAITLAESSLKEDNELTNNLLKKIFPYAGKSLRLGISGIPGAGKSTFIDGLGKMFTGLKKKVAVLTVDPSSTISKGSILADKTRMDRLSSDPLAFIRTSPSQSHLGGVTPHTRKLIAYCEAAGYEIIIIETVGTGQSETEVHQMTDFFILLMIAGAGDDLQGMKKGIIEISDLILVNKADGSNIQAALRTQKELSNILPIANNGAGAAEVLTFSSWDNDQFPPLWENIASKIQRLKKNGIFEKKRAQQRLSWMNEAVHYQLLEAFYSDKQVEKMLQTKRKEVEEGKITSIAAAAELIKIFKKNN
jgi:LAO/AO transport system kinase